MRQFYFSYKQVKHAYLLLCTYAVSCGRFNITVNRDYLHAQNQGKLASICLQQFSSIFETTITSVSADTQQVCISRQAVGIKYLKPKVTMEINCYRSEYL